MPKIIIYDIKKTNQRNIDKAVNYIFSYFDILYEDRKFLIKPNVIGPYDPKRGVTTSPLLIRSLCKFLLAKKAIVYVGDNPGGMRTNNYETFLTTGLAQASMGCYRNIGNEATEVPLCSGPVRSAFVSKILFNVDYVINVPRFKTACYTTMSCAIKNMFGIVPGSHKAQLHLAAKDSTEFAEILLSIYMIKPPLLTVVDALTVMEGNGPVHGKLRPFNKILASDDGICLDTAVAFMMGAQITDVSTLKVAARRIPKSIDLSNAEIVGQLNKISNFALPSITYVKEADKELMTGTFTKITKVKPRICKDRTCTLCRTCEENCPVQAIIVKDKPYFNYSRCISCYCCNELCPEGVIELSADTQQIWDVLFNHDKQIDT